MVEQRSPKPRAEGSSPSAPAKNNTAVIAAVLFFYTAKKNPRHAERAGHFCRSAAGGGNSEAEMAQRSKFCGAPSRIGFWVPQVGLRSNYSPSAPAKNNTAVIAAVLFFIPTKKEPEVRGACRAFLPMRRRWLKQRGRNGAAVKILRRSKPHRILGTASGVAKQLQSFCQLQNGTTGLNDSFRDSLLPIDFTYSVCLYSRFRGLLHDRNNQR